MKRLVLGITAHVDSGKTTLSEAMLYTSGKINRLGRVDHKDSYLDNNPIERERGITVFSKQAQISFGNTEITLLDTPGHVDFSAETEQTLCVLDYAVLVINASDGVQSHTETLWKLLDYYNIPTFIFINKTDLPDTDRDLLLDNLKKQLSDACIDFSSVDGRLFEEAAVFDSDMFDEYVNSETVSDKSLSRAIKSRQIFPCFFGSALKNTGVKELLTAIDRFTEEKPYSDEFGAKIYKIADDDKGQKLTFMKITGGKLSVKDELEIDGNIQKVNELRVYSGAKYNTVQSMQAGGICAVCGLTQTYHGEGIGFEPSDSKLYTEPIFTYAATFPNESDTNKILGIFRKLEVENSQLRVLYNEKDKKINVQVMGDVQLEILKRVLLDRFGLSVIFEHGSIIYKETICDKFEGVGHYEPLRHYAEVHLLIEPAKRSSGIVFKSDCDLSVLGLNFQRLVLTHLREKVHTGVLTCSPLTDVKITLVNGKAHLKHTEGGDFRQATYRALRQGLMLAKSANKCVLLEPFYSFTLELQLECVGRAMTDLDRMGAEFVQSETSGQTSKISGVAPISGIHDYAKSVISYTHGKGRLNFSFKEYAPCKNQSEIVKNMGYDAEADVSNTADSIFCSHGSGYLVKWNDVYNNMHLPLLESENEIPIPIQKRDFKKLIDDEAEILKIFEMTYGKIKRRPTEALHTPKVRTASVKTKPSPPKRTTYLLIDGYNIIHAWDCLREAAQNSLDLARSLLINKVCNYQAMRKINVILVFDAYMVKNGQREIEKIHGISVVYTKEAETADQYIERTSTELSKNYQVRVATSDGQIQMIIFGNGAVRVTATEFQAEVEKVEKEMRDFIVQPENEF